MFSQRLVTRNVYLQSMVDIFNPTIVNECVETAMKNTNIIWPPEERGLIDSKIFPLEPQSFGVQANKFKSKLAYGDQGLKKVVHEIGSIDPIKQYAALNSLSDILYDSLQYSRAVKEFEIVKRLEDAFFRNMPQKPGRASTFDIILKNFLIVSSYFKGAQLMMKQFNLIDTFYEMILCDSWTSRMCAQVLKNLSAFPSIAEEMVYYNHLKKLKKVFDCTPISQEFEDLFIHLSQLISVNPSAAISDEYFEFLFKKIKVETHLQTAQLKCFGLILNCKEGQEKVDEIDGVKILYDLFKSESLNNNTLEFVSLAFQNATLSKISLWRCREFWDLPFSLIRGAFNNTNPNLQLYSLQTLRQITTMPSVKNFVGRTCKVQIKKIPCLSQAAEEVKQNLLMWLRKEIYLKEENKKQAGKLKGALNVQNPNQNDIDYC